MVQSKMAELREIELINDFIREVLEINDPKIRSAVFDVLTKMYIFAYLVPGGTEYQLQFAEFKRSVLVLIGLLQGSVIVCPEYLRKIANTNMPDADLIDFAIRNKGQFLKLVESTIPG